MNVLVTGDMGFIGGHVSRVLERIGHTAHGVDRKRGAMYELSTMPVKAYRDFRVESVIHLAALADVRGNWAEGQMDLLWRDNLEATRRVLDMAASLEVRAFVFTSTGAVYAPQMSPYAATKMACEHLCKAYADKYGWNLLVIRPAACFGAGYHHGHVADFVRMAKAHGKIRSLTRGEPKDALHVEDLAEVLVDGATGGLVGTHYMRAFRLWGCRDTANAMGVEAEWSYGDSGWLGDTVESPNERNVIVGTRDVALGVADALRSLGWGS